MTKPMSEPYFCPDCDDAPPGWDHFEPAWIYCPLHGVELLTAAELETDAAQARADVLRDERFDIHKVLPGILGFPRSTA